MTAKDIKRELAAPFPIEEVEFKVQAKSPDKKKGMVVAYLKTHAIIDRLDRVADRWEESSKVLLLTPEHVVVQTRLTLWRGDWHETHNDVGESFPRRDGAPASVKEAWSDSLKRAAARFGIGRYLSKLKKEWVRLNEKGEPLEEDMKRVREAYVKQVKSLMKNPGGDERGLAFEHILRLMREAARQGQSDVLCRVLADSDEDLFESIEAARRFYVALRDTLQEQRNGVG